MKKKFFTMIILCFLVSAMAVNCFAVENVTEYNTPISKKTTQLLWSKQFGTTYRDAPSTMTVVGDTIIVMSKKKLYKLDEKTGEIIAQADMASSPNYGYTPPLYADSKIFVPLNNATIQAFDFKTLKPLWIYSDSLGGQSLTPITYSDGYIFTGFWNDEDKDANYVALSVKDEDKSKSDEMKKPLWTYKSNGGFYWAESFVKNDFIFFGTDNGTSSENGKSKIVSLNKLTGKQIDSFQTLGDIRSGIKYDADSGKCFFTSKAGYLYSFGFSDNGMIDDSSVVRLSLSGASTSTPAIFKGRIYVGVQGGGFSEGYIKVIDAEKMNIVYSAKMKGYPQSSVRVSSYGYKTTGKIYIYSTYNSSPGGVTLLTDSQGQTSAHTEEIFVPEEGQKNNSISTIAVSSNGTLFYKNDSGYIFALKNTESKKTFWEVVWYYISLPFVWLKNLIFGK